MNSTCEYFDGGDGSPLDRHVSARAAVQFSDLGPRGEGVDEGESCNSRRRFNSDYVLAAHYFLRDNLP